MAHVTPWVFLCGVLALPGSRVAHAESSGSGAVSGDLISATVHYGTPPASSGSGCTWKVVTGVDPIVGTSEKLVQRMNNGASETLYHRLCPAPIGDGGYHWIPDHVAPRIANESHKYIEGLIPRLLFHTAPRVGSVVTNVGTWFWVPREIWQPFSVKAYIETPIGIISVTTTAKPTSLVFTPGDGAPNVSCKGPGQPWQESYGDTMPSSCMYTYRHASTARRGGVFPARASVEWTISWRTNLWGTFLGVGTNLGHVTTGIAVPVRVREIQALAN